MLVAQQQNGELFVLTKSIAPEMLKQIRQQQSFYCPQCKERLQLKVGSIKIPHFAHYQHSTCDGAFSEGETPTHILGKQQLYQLFSQLQLPVQLEKTILTLQQRPDLLIELPSVTYAIEYQYSAIDPLRFQERNAGYRSVHVQPIWIVHTPKTIATSGIQRLNISYFHQLFQQRYKGRTYICTYCPKQQRFFYITYVLPLHKNAYIVKVDSLSLAQQRFPLLVPKSMTLQEFQDAFTLYKEQMRAHLRAVFKYNRQGVQHMFLRYLYELRLGLEELPLFLMLPIVGSECMQVVHSGWQCALFYFTQQLGKSMWELKMSEVQLFFTCMKLPYNKETIEVLRRYVRICRRFAITSVYTSVEESKLVAELYEQYCEH